MEQTSLRKMLQLRGMVMTLLTMVHAKASGKLMRMRIEKIIVNGGGICVRQFLKNIKRYGVIIIIRRNKNDNKN